MAQQQLTIAKAEPLTIVSSEPLSVVKEEQQEPSGMQRAASAFLKWVPNPIGIARGIRKIAQPENIPTAGAIGGGILGGLIGNVPGAIAGAGLGGALGKGGELMARDTAGEDVPQTAGGVLGAMATRGAGEAALQAAGGVVGKGLQAAAKPIYNLGLGAAKSLRREYPNLAQTGIEEAIAVSGRGADKARALRTASREQADAMIAQAERAGAAPVSSREVVAGLRPVRSMAKDRVAIGQADETPEIAARARKIKRAVPRSEGTPGTPAVPPTRVSTPDLPDSVDAAIRANNQLGPLARNIPTVTFGGDEAIVNAARQIGPQANLVPRRLLGNEIQKGTTIELGGEEAIAATAGRELGIPLTRAQTLKRTAQDSADKAFTAERRGTPITNLSPEIDKAVARGFQQAIERRVPNVASINSRTQALGGLTNALDDATDRNQLMRMLLVPGALGVTSGMTTGDVGAGLGTTAGAAMLTSPGNLSRVAIGLDRTGRFNLPVHAIRAAMLAMMSGDDK